MPTPTVYTLAEWNPFADVPPALQGDKMSVLYVTDRIPEDQTHGQWKYGEGRSRSAAFGEAVVQIGDGASWDDIVRASRTSKRESNLELKLAATRELGRFGNTPPKLIISDDQLAAYRPPEAASAHGAAEQKFKEELAARLAKTPRKEVFIYVHGFNNTFEEAVLTTGEMFHFLGREGVPVCYTWPAGMGGLKAYNYTLASTDYTIYHFKQTLRLIASCPEVQKVHILGHSRGTAVTTDTLRELHLEHRGTPPGTQKLLKLGTIVLASPDIDLDVAIARNSSERIAQAVEFSAIYMSKNDDALSISNWMFGGIGRLGNMDIKMFGKDEIEAMRGSHRMQLIDARVKEGGSFGHSYYHANPAVGSDLVLLLRYRLRPGSEHGRPLGVDETGMWVVTDDYPGKTWKPPTTTGFPKSDSHDQ